MTNSNHINPELAIIRDFLKECIPFDQLRDIDLEQILSAIEINYYRKSHIFHSETESGGLRIVRSGAVELRLKDDKLIDRFGEGMSFNLLSLSKEQPGIRAQLIEDSLIYFLPEQDYKKIRSQHREFDRFFHSQRSRRIRRAARYETSSNEMMSLVRDIMSINILSTEPECSIKAAAKLMTDSRVSSLLIMKNSSLKGIVTDRDIRSRAVATGMELNLAIENIMSINPETIDTEQTIFDATLFMTQQGYHHLPVVESGAVKGIITASDLMLARRDDPVHLVQHIGRQKNYHELKSIVTLLPDLMVQWVNAGIRAEQVASIFTAISDAVTARLIELFIKKNGASPVPFTWLGFGSQGRAEQLLGGDQDNALLLHDSFTEKDSSWFKQLTHWVCDGLNECGYIYCPGNIMATNDELRLTLREWKATVDRWTRTPTKDAVMRVSIFFDIRAVYGDKTLCLDLQQHMLNQASSDNIFLAALTENALEHTPPLGIFRNFVVEHNGEHNQELDLKKRGLLPVIDTVRIHSLAHKIKAINTVSRLKQLAELKIMTIDESRNLQDALHIIMQARLKEQVKDLASGNTPNNYINPKESSKLMRKQLKDAFSIIVDAQKGLQMRYRPGI